MTSDFSVHDIETDLNRLRINQSNRQFNFMKRNSSKGIVAESKNHSPINNFKNGSEQMDGSQQNSRFKKSSVDFMISSLADVAKLNKEN